MCRYIPGDAPLYSMFRVDGAPVDCPFHGPLAFAYNRGKGECAWPQSQMESCTDPRRVAFHYQACPNVAGSEMRSEFATVLPSLGGPIEESPTWWRGEVTSEILFTDVTSPPGGGGTSIGCPRAEVIHG